MSKSVKKAGTILLPKGTGKTENFMKKLEDKIAKGEIKNPDKVRVWAENTLKKIEDYKKYK